VQFCTLFWLFSQCLSGQWITFEAMVPARSAYIPLSTIFRQQVIESTLFASLSNIGAAEYASLHLRAVFSEEKPEQF
jgi:hypothetical protein